MSALVLFILLSGFFFCPFLGYTLKIFQFKKIIATHLFHTLFFLIEKGFNYNYCRKALKAASDD